MESECRKCNISSRNLNDLKIYEVLGLSVLTNVFNPNQIRLSLHPISVSFLATVAAKQLCLSCAGQLCRSPAITTSMLSSRFLKMRVVQFQPPHAESYEDKNSRLSRPLSPHLSIYKPQMQTILSVAHRGTGIVAYVYALGLAAGSFLPMSYPEIVSNIAQFGLPSALIFAGKWALVFPVTFHTLSGIRHLNWDIGRSLSIKGVFNTGYAVLILSVIINSVITML